MIIISSQSTSILNHVTTPHIGQACYKGVTSSEEGEMYEMSSFFTTTFSLIQKEDINHQLLVDYSVI